MKGDGRRQIVIQPLSFGVRGEALIGPGIGRGRFNVDDTALTKL